MNWLWQYKPGYWEIKGFFLLLIYLEHLLLKRSAPPPPSLFFQEREWETCIKRGIKDPTRQFRGQKSPPLPIQSIFFLLLLRCFDPEDSNSPPGLTFHRLHIAHDQVSGKRRVNRSQSFFYFLPQEKNITLWYYNSQAGSTKRRADPSDQGRCAAGVRDFVVKPRQDHWNNGTIAVTMAMSSLERRTGPWHRGDDQGKTRSALSPSLPRSLCCAMKHNQHHYLGAG